VTSAPAARVVRSTNEVDIALHCLRADRAADHTLLVSHATGFHAHCYQPVVDQLAGTWHVEGLDYRGHGDTQRPDGPVVWERYGDDAVAVARDIVERTGRPIIGFGHSMGGACLLMAALRQPELFAALVVFEPIVFPPDGLRPVGDGPSPMVQAARRRRASFDSYEAAIANFAAKPPLNEFTATALDGYVRHGFREGDDGRVHLKCSPDTEADTFETGGGHRTWDHLGQITVPVIVVCGMQLPMQPGSLSPTIAELLPHGRLDHRDHLSHFGPMTAPGEIAAIIDNAV
jgi:pimeloyl-ACP methyl ester carboxylesterase